MKSIVTTALTFVVIVMLVSFVACGPKSLAQKEEELRQAWEDRIAWAINEVAKADFLYEPGTQACWVVYGHGYAHRGSVSYVPCEIARRRMAPPQLKALADAETKLSRLIP